MLRFYFFSEVHYDYITTLKYYNPCKLRFAHETRKVKISRKIRLSDMLSKIVVKESIFKYNTAKISLIIK